MFRRTLAVLLPLGVVAIPTALLAAPRSASDCENLKNDLAYNQCLATFGPAAKNIAGGGNGRAAIAAPSTVDTQAATGVPSVEEPQLRESPRRGRRGRSYRRSGGRQSASFEIGSAGNVSSGSEAVVERGQSRRSRYRSRRRR